MLDQVQFRLLINDATRDISRAARVVKFRIQQIVVVVTLVGSRPANA